MNERVSVLTRKGQVTIPADVRRILRLVQGDQVAFVIEDGIVYIRPKESIVERTAGIFKSDRPPLSAKELREAAEQAIADDVMERMSK